MLAFKPQTEMGFYFYFYFIHFLGLSSLTCRVFFFFFLEKLGCIKTEFLHSDRIKKLVPKYVYYLHKKKFIPFFCCFCAYYTITTDCLSFDKTKSSPMHLCIPPPPSKKKNTACKFSRSSEERRRSRHRAALIIQLPSLLFCVQCSPVAYTEAAAALERRRTGVVAAPNVASYLETPRLLLAAARES